MAALWGAGGAAGSRGARRARGGGIGAEPPPASPAQCCCLEEEEPGLHWGAASSDVPLEADGILGTMQSYLDSSVISILEDFSSLHEHKACLEAPNELSLLTAITEILDSTDDETLSPFDSTMDSELLALPRERESSSFQKFLSLSRPSPERGVPALDDAWGLSKVEPGPMDLPWDCPLSCLEESAAPKQRVSRAPRAEQKLPRPQLRERSDGEEEEGAASPGPPGELLQSPGELCEEAATWPDDGGAPCIISTADGSLSELVKSMHPYCLPTLTVCLDPASEPAAKEFLAGPLVLEIVPGAGESLEIPVVLQQLGPGAQLPAEEEAASGCPTDEEEGAREPSPPSPTQARKSPPGAGPEVEVGPRAQRQESRPQHCTEAPAGGKRRDTEKGRGRERARKSRKKQREGLQRGRAKPDGDRVGLRLRSASSGQPPASQPSPSRAARPSVQVSTFLEKQLEQARKDGQMELRAAQGRPRTAAVGGAPRRKGHPEVQEKPEAAKLNVRPAVQGTGAPGPSEQAPPRPRKQPADAGPSSAEQGEGSWPVPTKDSTGPETGAAAEAPRSPAEAERAGTEAAGWPPRPKALSLTEYRQRMLRRQPGGSHGKEGEKPAVSKWPSIPEPPTELAEIPCLMAPVRPPPSQPAQPGELPSSQGGPEKPSSPPATAPLASREPAISQRGPEKPSSPPATAPLACKAPLGPSQPVPAPLPPGPQLPFLPSPMGAAPAAIPPAAATPYALYPPVPSWPCFGPPPAGYPSLPPPTGGPPSAFHLVPGLPPPAMAWPSPALPPPPFGPGAPCASMGWALGLQPPYWPGVPVPPALAYSDLGAKPFPAGPRPEPEPLARGTACAHVPAPVPSYQEPPAFTTQPARPVPAQPSARATSGRACDPRTQSRPVGESPAPQHVGQSPALPPQPAGESPAPQHVGQSPALPPQPAGESPAPQHVAQPPALPPQPAGESPAPQPAGESPAPQHVGQPPALPPQPAGESPAPQHVGQPPALAPQPAGESPAPQHVGQPPALAPQPASESHAPQHVGQPPALAPQPVGESHAPQHVGDSPVPQPVGQPSALPPQPVGESPAPQHVGQPPALPPQPVGELPTPQPVGQPPDPCPPTEAAAPAKGAGPSLLEGSQPDSSGPVLQKPQLPGPPAVPRRAAVALGAREESQPTKPWRHRLLVSPARPGASKDIVQAFISEIGIEASDLSSLLEQFEKTEGTKELPRGQRPGDRLAAGNAGSESQQEKSPPDSLHAPELVNIAGLTPPATPPHQLWKPLAAVSLLGKARSPGAAPQEGGQNTAKFVEAKPLPQSKPRGKGPVPSHVGCGDHDYCAWGTAQPEEGTRLPSTPAPSELGSRWNVKRHQDITIKPPSSLPTRTLACSGLRTAPGSSQPLDHRTRARSQAAAGRSSPPTSVLLSPAASPCRDEEPQSGDPQPAAKRSLRCYRRRAASPSPRARASRSFSSTSNGASTSSSSSSSSSRSRSRSRSLSPPPKRWRRYRSRRSHSSHSSRSSCGSCGRSRGRSPSSASSYSSRSSSASRSRSRSPSPRRRSNRRRRFDYCDPPDHCQRQRILHKERAIEERRVVFIGKIPSRMTRAELRHRFSVFGDIEECTLHFRAEGDNYGFVTYRYAKEAFAAIESGHQLRRPDEQPFDLCFGGRRQFCRRNYADLDSNREDFDPAPVKSKFDSLDFDTLLKQAQRNLRR